MPPPPTLVVLCCDDSSIDSKLSTLFSSPVSPYTKLILLKLKLMKGRKTSQRKALKRNFSDKKAFDKNFSNQSIFFAWKINFETLPIEYFDLSWLVVGSAATAERLWTKMLLFLTIVGVNWTLLTCINLTGDFVLFIINKLNILMEYKAKRHHHKDGTICSE